MTIDELIKALQALCYRTPALARTDVYLVDAGGLAFEVDRVRYDEEECDVRITAVEL